jgi:hypothetical protein
MGEMSDITVVIANWRRPGNIDRIFKSLPAGCQRFVLDNSNGRHPLSNDVLAETDWVLTSTINEIRLRWTMAAMARTEYFCVHDDDLIVHDWSPYIEAVDGSGLCGPFGVRLNYDHPHAPYSRGKHVTAGPVDVVKGRFVVGRVDLLRESLKFRPGFDHLTDDINAAVDYPGAHSCLCRSGQLTELPAPHGSSTTNPKHYQLRDQACAGMLEVFRQKSPCISLEFRSWQKLNI